ncbi:MAG: 23S rRNA (adenine(2503)-C(2))-methyltransferase RlmN [Clostridiales bacterium]|nr:23S rRNA (adenine(2503)-C(2))-methyltransferase RlmN [Clostridiales bacterium]
MDVGGLFLEELAVEIERLHEPKYRAGQIFRWMHQRNAVSFQEMSDLPKGLRDKLEEEFRISTSVAIIKKSGIPGEDTTKYLLEAGQGTIIESVSMAYGYGRTACVSTQAGCAMGCVFCASGEMFERSMTAGEMCGQAYAMQRDTGEKFSRVVLMGSGEPLANYDESLRFVRLVSDPGGANVGRRRITLSTCGLPREIEKLSKEGLALTLAVSLHASNDETRARLMPKAASICSVKELAKVCREYANVTKRRVTYEHTMIKGVNDSLANAKELAGLLAGDLCHVNLIPLNGIQALERSPAKTVEAFAGVLSGKGIPVTVRRSLGAGIEAACGQLKAGHKTLD